MVAARLNRSSRLKRLLEAGHLPEELPPPFVSTEFAKYRRAIENRWIANNVSIDKFQSTPEPYSVPRYGHARRRVVIVNPINQFRVSKIIADNWVEIKKHLRRSKITEFRPIFDLSGQRSLFGVNWTGISESRVRISARYASQFQTDISKFYPSIYTHSIAWAYYGKSFVQANLNAPVYKNSFLNTLDIAVRHGQRNQSVGIPIGPDSSRIIAEIVAVGIEAQIRLKISDLDKRGLRYVDDFTIGIDENENDELISAAFEKALSHFELDVNFEKTIVVGHKTNGELRWKQELSAIQVGRLSSVQRDQLDQFFGAAIVYSEKSEKDAVLKWALKRSRSFKIEKSNLSYYIETALSVTRRAPACFPALAQILIDARYRGLRLPIESIRKFIIDHIRIHAPIGHSFEVGWALFLCKGLSIHLKRKEVEDIFEMRSSICALLLMDIDRRGLVDGGIDDAFWQNECASPQGLKSDLWLLSYEAVRKSWWSGGPHAYVLNDPVFGPLLSQGVYFYDERRNVLSTRRDTRRSVQHWRLSRFVLTNWEEYF